MSAEKNTASRNLSCIFHKLAKLLKKNSAQGSIVEMSPFARYSPLNCTVTLKLGFGSLKVIESCTITSADYETPH